MNDSRVLVVGATGQLGGVITRKLIASGVRVRALARNREALAPLASTAEIAAVDLRDLPKLTEACRGVDQIVATANNNMGKGPTSPTRIDLSGYQNLCAAARNTRVRRLVYVSYKGVAQDAPVDIFRVKWYIEDAIRRSGVPCVMLRPTAFMDVWIDQILAKGIREKGVATIFGDGNTVANYIAVDDVAEFAVKILEREVVNEVVEAGGPSERLAEPPGHPRRAPLEVVREAPARAGSGDASAPSHRPALQRGCGPADDARPVLRDGVEAVSRMAGVRRSIWRSAADRRDVRRSDRAIAR